MIDLCNMVLWSIGFIANRYRIPPQLSLCPLLGVTLSFARRAMEPGHLLHSALSCPSSGISSSNENNKCDKPPPQRRWTFPILFAQMWYGCFCELCVTQKIKPLTMFSSSVQSIDLPVNCTAWRFWMRQSFGCSTLAPRSSVAKQWTERTGSWWSLCLRFVGSPISANLAVQLFLCAE